MSADATREALKQFRRKLRDVLEHEPRELHIAINGRILGSQTVNADLNRQNLLLEASEKIDFIEIFSEQGMRLLSMSVDPPPTGPFERRVEAQLSGDRSLQAMLSFTGPCPSLEIVYRDPNFRTTTDAEPAFRTQPSVVADLLPVDETQTTERPLRPLRRLQHLKWNSRPALGVIATATAMILIALFALYRTPISPVSAAELLRQSVEAETAAVTTTDIVLHRSLNLSVRDPHDGRLHLQQRIETWQSPSIKARRLFDDKNRLVAGEWRRNDGSSTLYRSGEAPQQRAHSRLEATSPLTIDDAWLREPSAGEFARLAADAAELTVLEEGNAFRLTMIRPASQTAVNQVNRSTIVLSRPGMRPVAQIMVVNTADGVREFLLSETKFERRNSSEVAAVIFEPDAIFFPAKELVLAVVAEEAPVPTPSLTPLPSVATAELEIEVLSLLNEVGATIGEEVSVARTLDGSLMVTGVVDGNERKSAILSALTPIAGNPVIKLQIETAEEAQLRLEKSRTASEAVIVQIEETAPATGTIAVDAELRRYLLAKGTPTDKLDEEVNQFANRALRSSRQAVLYAWSLRRMVQRFSVSELQSLDREARLKWLTMIGEHTAGYEREIAGLRTHLSLAFAARAAVDETATEIVDEAGLARIILRMAELSTVTDETIRAAFTLSKGDPSAMSSSQFWRTMSNAEFLARRIEQIAQQLKVSSSRVPR